eukprot:1137770-Pelagomonas_calceolata.AAC.7
MQLCELVDYNFKANAPSIHSRSSCQSPQPQADSSGALPIRLMRLKLAGVAFHALACVNGLSNTGYPFVLKTAVRPAVSV